MLLNRQWYFDDGRAMCRSLCQFLMLPIIVTWLACGVRADEPDQALIMFHKPVSAAAPRVRQMQRVKNPIDQFIFSKLESERLQAAPEADRRMLVRRLYFDLIGLPPTPQDVARFIAAKDANAYEKLVDRLLDDPRYGERWARFWLDLARYADTAGFEGDPDLPHAWRYRDYVIDAFNNDKPYDQFIREQIAGDELKNIMGAGELPQTPPENVVALTFLRLAPFTEPRGDETRHELLSEMTATVSSVFLGLTVGCAKCHDHKYDNIPTRDFYRLKAFFSTISIPPPERGDGFQIGGPLPAAFYRPGEQAWAEKKRAALQASVTQSKQELKQLTQKLERRLGTGGVGFGLQSMMPSSGNDYFFDTQSVHDGKPHRALINCDGSSWTWFTDGVAASRLGSLSGRNQGQWFGDLADLQHLSLGQHTAGSGQPKQSGHQGHFAEILIYDHPLDAAERMQLDRYLTNRYAAKPQTATARQPLEPPRRGLSFWLDAADLDGDPQTQNPQVGTRVAAWKDKIQGLTLSQAKQKLQPQMDRMGQAAAVAFDGHFLKGAANTASFRKHQQGALAVVFSARHTAEGYGFEAGGAGAFLSTVIYPDAPRKQSLAQIIANAADKRISPQDRRRYFHLSNRERFVKQQLKRLQPVAMSLRHSFGPPYEPGVPTSRVMIRGEWNQPGEVVQPGFLTCLTGSDKPAVIRLDPFQRWPTRSRRLALANWIASKDNPLTARVMVNRLWHWHFGRGLVATPSDFGTLSGGPSHPKLLDWLALKFMEHKWSIKSIHRLICNSSTYRQTSLHSNPQAERTDPDNIMLWRFRRRRLNSEAIRDSVLAVSGRLNSEQHGLPIFPPLPDEIDRTVKYTQSKWNTQLGPESRKRSIYVYQQRTLTMPFMQVFDALVCDESRPRRRSSVTPLQVLAMYNGEFVNQEASHFAERVRKAVGPDTSAQVARAFQLALGRDPSRTEAERMQQFFATTNNPQQALRGVCRILYNSNEFLYVD